MKNTPSFTKHGKRRLLCPACGGYLTDTYLTDKKTKSKRCKKCKCTIDKITPPRSGTSKDGKQGVYFGAMATTFTAVDLTEVEQDDVVQEENVETDWNNTK